MISTFNAEVESMAKAGHLSMGDLACMVTARNVWTDEQVEFRVPSIHTDLKIGRTVTITVQWESM